MTLPKNFVRTGEPTDCRSCKACCQAPARRHRVRERLHRGDLIRTCKSGALGAARRSRGRLRRREIRHAPLAAADHHSSTLPRHRRSGLPHDARPNRRADLAGPPTDRCAALVVRESCGRTCGKVNAPVVVDLSGAAANSIVGFDAAKAEPLSCNLEEDENARRFGGLFIPTKRCAAHAFHRRFNGLPNVRVVQGRFADLEPHDCFVTAGNAFGIMTAGIDAAVVARFGKTLMRQVPALHHGPLFWRTAGRQRVRIVNRRSRTAVSLPCADDANTGDP